MTIDPRSVRLALRKKDKHWPVVRLQKDLMRSEIEIIQSDIIICGNSARLSSRASQGQGSGPSTHQLAHSRDDTDSFPTPVVAVQHLPSSFPEGWPSAPPGATVSW